MGFRRILISVDSSPIAAHAADVGVELARSLSAEVAFVHAIEPLMSPETGISPAQLEALAERDGKLLIDGFSQRASLQPPPLTFTQIGKPADVIIKAASDWAADVIVLGSHGRGGVTRALIGSVAEDVLRHAPCPVFVVRTHYRY
jgi:nucleotide-binding universal stress UspA family protein